MGKQVFDVPRQSIFMFEPEDLTIIGLDTPHKAGEHPLYDERIKLEVRPEDVQNVIFYGVKMTIIAVKDGDKAVVLDGRQRTRWARAANVELKKRGLDTLRVAVRFQQGDDKDLLGVLVSCNEIRKDDDVLTKAEKAHRLATLNMDEKSICVSFGVKPQTIKNWALLISCAPEVKAAIRQEELSPTVGFRLGRESREDQGRVFKALMEHKKRGEAPTVTLTEGLIRNLKSGNPLDEDEDEVIEAAEPQLSATAAKEQKRNKIIGQLQQVDKQLRAELAPHRRLLRGLVKGWDENEPTIHLVERSYIHALRWVLGDIGDRQIAGMTAAIRVVRRKGYSSQLPKDRLGSESELTGKRDDTDTPDPKHPAKPPRTPKK